VGLGLVDDEEHQVSSHVEGSSSAQWSLLRREDDVTFLVSITGLLDTKLFLSLTRTKS
jgi:hypothetical protein